MRSSSFLLRLVGLLFFLFGVAGANAQYSWSTYQSNPLLTNAIQPAVIYDSVSHQYRMWFISLGTGVKEATSSDGQAWMVRDSVELAPGPAGAFDYYIHALCVAQFGDSLAMYYTCSTDYARLVIGRAVSADGTHWVKSPNQPVLTYGPAGAWDSYAVGADAVLLRKGIFRMWFGGSDGSKTASGYAESTDGSTWSRYPGNPVLPTGSVGSYDEKEAGIVGLDWHDTLAVAVYQSITAGGAMSFSVATSPDGISWTKNQGNPVYVPPASGWDAYSMGGGTLLWTNGRFNYWYCGYSGGYWSVGLAFLQPPGALVIRPGSLDFGWVRVNTTDTVSMMLANPGKKDSLHVVSITSDDSVFAVSNGPLVIPPGDSLALAVMYTPKAMKADSGSITFVTGSPSPQTIRVFVRGKGFQLMNSPLITNLARVPDYYSEVRIIWLRSLGDTLGAADPVTQYSVWRQTPGTNALASTQHPGSTTMPASVMIDPPWDFVATVPAANLDRYSYIAPILSNYAQPYAWTTFMVAAHTRGAMVYRSAPDSIQYDPPVFTATGPSGLQTPRECTLDQNYPNPFNPTTTIRYGLPERSSVKLDVYNILGQLVATLENGERESGVHEVRFDGSRLASGVYFYRLQVGSFVKTMRLLLLR